MIDESKKIKMSGSKRRSHLGIEVFKCAENNLGILETLGVLKFKMTGGTNSQIYIHINQIRNLKNIIDNQDKYKNKILESVVERHKISVAMLTYIYENNFDSAHIWDLLEDYFFGKIPAEVKFM